MPNDMATLAVAGGLLAAVAVAAQGGGGNPPPGGSFSVCHVAFNDAMFAPFLTRFAPYVKQGDIFMLGGGNPERAAGWTTQLKSRYGGSLKVVYAMLGMAQLQVAASGGFPFDGLAYDYEPHVQVPEFTYDWPITQQRFAAAAALTRSAGYEAWTAPTGQTLPGRSHAGEWDWGRIAAMFEGTDVQAQASCKAGNYPQTVDYVLGQAAAIGSVGQIWMQVTTGVVGLQNAVPPTQAMDCARYAAGKAGVAGITLWAIGGGVEQENNVARFLELRG